MYDQKGQSQTPRIFPGPRPPSQGILARTKVQKRAPQPEDPSDLGRIRRTWKLLCPANRQGLGQLLGLGQLQGLLWIVWHHFHIKGPWAGTTKKASDVLGTFYSGSKGYPKSWWRKRARWNLSTTWSVCEGPQTADQAILLRQRQEPQRLHQLHPFQIDLRQL